MPESTLPRYLDARLAAMLRLSLEGWIRTIRAGLVREGADPACLDHEIGMALARSACRFDFDILNGAGATIERLEAVVAELGAKLEQAKVAANGHVDPFAEALARRTAAGFRHDMAMREAEASAELAASGVCAHPRQHRERGDEFNPDRCGLCHEILP